MATIKKQNIYIDAQQQHKEKNIDIRDYPVYNIETNRQLKHTFSHYFKDLDEYFSSKNPNYKNWDKEYKYTSREAAKFFDNIQKTKLEYGENFKKLK